MLILIDGFQPEGITQLIQDSVFMMPHLGILGSLHQSIASEIFEKDCIVHLGTCIAPSGSVKKTQEEIELANVRVSMPDGKIIEENLISGKIHKIPLGTREIAEVEIRPHSGYDVGAGPGRRLTSSIEGGEGGVLLDGRGRPITLPEDREARIEKLLDWLTAVDAYPYYELKA
jgi:hypothetical protein